MRVQVWRKKSGIKSSTWRPRSLRQTDGPQFPADFEHTKTLQLDGVETIEICEAAYDIESLSLGDIVVLETDEDHLPYVVAPLGFERVPLTSW